MKYFVTFLMILSVMAFAGEHKDHSHAKMDKAGAMACELQDGEACTTISISSAHCECGATEKAIGEALKGVGGVTMAKVDVKNHTAHVHYKSADVKPATLEKAIAAVGFDANDVKANKDAQAKLPQCCKPQ